MLVGRDVIPCAIFGCRQRPRCRRFVYPASRPAAWRPAPLSLRRCATQSATLHHSACNAAPSQPEGLFYSSRWQAQRRHRL